MRPPWSLLLLCGLAILACRFSPAPEPAPVNQEEEVAATATAALPAFSPGQELTDELEELLLTPEELPVEAGYYLAEPNASSPFHNTEVVAAWGGLRGWDYLQATGRVDGYYADYLRGSEIPSAPEEFFCNVTVFTTPEGALLSLTDYNLVAIAEPDDPQWSYVENAGLDLGDFYLVLTSREAQPVGEERIWYRIEFSYRNLVGVVAGFGPVDTVTPEFMEGAARALLAKLEAAPIAQP